MRKRLFILVLFMIISILQPNLNKRKTTQSIRPFALVQTIRDQEVNDSFAQAIIVEQTNTNINSQLYKNNYVGGILSSQSDVDYYCFRLFYEANITFRLEMIDSNKMQTYNYNFEIYEQKNKLLPELNSDDFNLLFSSSNYGTYESYSFTSEATNYYIKIYNGGYTSSQIDSYKFTYNITPTERRSFNIHQQATNNPDGGAIVWEADYVHGNIRHDISDGVSKHYGTGLNTYLLANDYAFYDGYPTFEIYFWGVEWRNKLVSYLEDIINQLENKRQTLINVKVGVSILSQGANLCFQIWGAGEIISSVLRAFTGVSSGLISFIISTNISRVDELINYYNMLIQFIEDKEGELDDNNVYAITYKTRFIPDTDSGNFIRGEFNNSGCRFTSDREYNTTHIYDIREFDHDSDGVYTKIYGKYYLENVDAIINSFVYN